MRIHWFSPLPPAPTDIAGYTARVLAVLGRRAEVVVWTEQPDWDPPPVGVSVHRYRADDVPAAEVNRADLNVYHLGNNHQFHAAIWRVSRRHPGLVALHEPALADLFLGTFRHHLDDREGYCREMARIHGAAARDLAAAYWDGRMPGDYMARRFPLTPLAIEGALGVLTHNRAVFDGLAARGESAVAYAPLPYPCRARPELPRPSTRRPYRLAMFGYMNANRRLEPVLRFLADFPERDHFHLHVYGSHLEDAKIAVLVAELDLGRHVTRHGFVTEEELEQALDDADLAINLRWPTMGEASGSQLRIWDHALPSLVTPVGWYATLPAEAVAFVRPEHEAEDLAAHLRAFLRDPGAFARMGREGRRRLEQDHAVTAYVDLLLAAADEAVRQAPRQQAYGLAERAGRELGGWLGPASEGLGRTAAERIAQMFA